MDRIGNFAQYSYDRVRDFFSVRYIRFYIMELNVARAYYHSVA